MSWVPLKKILLVLLSFSLFSQDEGYAKNDNVNIFYLDHGPKEGTPILMIQGLGAQLTYWPDDLISLLQENGYRPIVFDNRDAGLSDNFDAEGRPPFIWNYIKFYLNLPMHSVYSLEDMANDGIAVMNHLQINHFHVLGISMGGMISQRLVADHQERVITFIQIASMAKSPDVSTAPKGELRRLITDRSNKELSQEERVNRAIRIYEILGTEGVTIDREEFAKSALANIKRGKSKSGFSRQLQAILADKDRYNKLNNITVPTLIIHGTIDPLIPFEEGKKTSELIANNTFVEVKTMSHLIDKPVLEKIRVILINHLDGIILEQDMIL